MFLSPLELCARVCALIPAPGFHMVRYYGCLNSHSSLRKEVVPVPAAAVEDPLDPDAGQFALELGVEGDDEAQEGARKRRPWACLSGYVW